jgi:hypothetical protein
MRLAMDQVAAITAQRTVIGTAAATIAAGDDRVTFQEILQWLAYAPEGPPGYFDPRTSDEMDLAALVEQVEEKTTSEHRERGSSPAR